MDTIKLLFFFIILIYALSVPSESFASNCNLTLKELLDIGDPPMRTRNSSELFLLIEFDKIDKPEILSASYFFYMATLIKNIHLLMISMQNHCF